MAGLLAYAAMLNPLRADTLHQLLSSSWYADPESCCCFDSEVQSAARWNAHLRGIAIKTGRRQDLVRVEVCYGYGLYFCGIYMNIN